MVGLEIFISYFYQLVKRDKVIDEAERLADALILRGVDVYFLLPPLLTNSNYLLTAKAYLEMDGYNVIDISSPDTYPEVYEIQNVRDIRHLNRGGALLNTENLAKEYLKLKESAQ